MSEQYEFDPAHDPGKLPAEHLKIVPEASPEAFIHPEKPNLKDYSSRINQIFLGSEGTPGRILALANITFEAYFEKGIDDCEPGLRPTEDDIKELYKFANFLYKPNVKGLEGQATKGDREIERILMIIDDELESVEPLSPIPWAKAIEKARPLNREPVINTQIAKLWTVENSTIYDDLPSSYAKFRKTAAEQTTPREIRNFSLNKVLGQ